MELYINGTLVDLERGIPFPLTFQIGDIRDIEKRKGNSSKTIKLPGTNVNTRLMSSVFTLTDSALEGAGSVIVYEFDPSIKAPAQAYENGVLQFSGMAQLVDCEELDGVWTFNIVLLSDSIDYMSDFKRVKLRELGWSEYNHDLIAARQSETWSGTIQKNGVPTSNVVAGQWTGDGYYYGLIDYGYDRPAEDAFEVGQITPSIFMKTILDKLFEASNLTYTSIYLNSQEFNRQLLCYEGGNFPNITPEILEENSIETDQINSSIGSLIDWTFFHPDPVGYTPVPFFSYLIDYNSDSGTDVDPGSHIQSSVPLKFVATGEGDYQINYRGDHDYEIDFTLASSSTGAVNDYAPNVQCYVQTVINGVVVFSEEAYSTSPSSQSYPFAGFNFTVSYNYSRDIYLEVSDIVEVRLVFRFPPASKVALSSGFIDGTYEYKVTATSCELDLSYVQGSVIAGSEVNLRAFLPKMDGATFFKGIVNMANLYVQPDPNDNRNLIIEPLNTFYNGSNAAIDWTEKLDHSKKRKVTPTINLSSKEYFFGFADDKDYWNNRYFEDVVEQYGSKTLESSSQFATGETKVVLPFSNKLLGQLPNTNLIVPRNFTVKTDQSGISEITPKRGKPFVVQIRKGNVISGENMQDGDWNHIDETGSDNILTQYPYVGHLDDLEAPTFDLMFGLPSYVFYELPPSIGYTTNNLYIYHEKFIKEILSKHGKMLTAYFMLNADDINKLDFANLIKIAGVVYRLQKVENYDSTNDESTKCELIRIIEGESIQTTTIEYLTPGFDNTDQFAIPSVANARRTENQTMFSSPELRITEDTNEVRETEN